MESELRRAQDPKYERAEKARIAHEAESAGVDLEEHEKTALPNFSATPASDIVLRKAFVSRASELSLVSTAAAALIDLSCVSRPWPSRATRPLRDASSMRDEPPSMSSEEARCPRPPRPPVTAN